MTRNEKNKIVTENLVKQGFPIERIKASMAECDNNYMPLTDVDLELFSAITKIADAYHFECIDLLDHYVVTN